MSGIVLSSYSLQTFFSLSFFALYGELKTLFVTSVLIYSSIYPLLYSLQLWIHIFSLYLNVVPICGFI